MTENTLEITENGKYKNIDIKNLSNGDSVLFTKKYAKAYKGTSTRKTGDKKEFDYFSCQGTYKGQEVAFFMPGTFYDGEYTSSEENANAYENTGGEGDTIKIIMEKGLGKDKKGKDAVVMKLTFELVN